VRALATWKIWSLPRYGVAVLLGVEFAAVLLPVTGGAKTTAANLRIALLLTLLSITYSVATVTFERLRVLLAKGTSPSVCPDLISTWSFAAAIMLPAWLAAIVVIVCLAVDWPARNVARQTEVYRYVYSCAAALIATVTANRLHRVDLPVGASVLLAAVGFVAVTACLLALAMISTGQSGRLQVLLQPRTYAIEAATLGIAGIEVLVADLRLPLVWVSLPAAVAIQQWSSRKAVQAALSVPEPLGEQVWLHIARTMVAGCPMSAVLRVDTDSPAALRAMTTLVKSGLDAIGSYRGGLAILLLDCPDQHATALAMRLRAALAQDGGGVAVAVAASPRDGRSLDELLVLTEAELAVCHDATERAQ